MSAPAAILAPRFSVHVGVPEREGSDMPNSGKSAGVRAAEIIHRIARRQKGVVTRGQLLAAGVKGHVIDHALTSHRLIVLHRGVYQAGPVLQPWGRELAAVLACRDGAVVSHRSAAVLWGLLPSSPERTVDVTVAGPLRGRHDGICVHRVNPALPRVDTPKRDGVPVTSPARTLLDLAATGSAAELQRALDTSEQERIVTVRALRSLLARSRGRRGVARLASLLPASGQARVTRSHLERTFLHLLRRYGLAVPATNVSLHGFVVDCYWREAGLVVELDGYVVHGTRPSFEADRRRNAVLIAAGLRVLRLSWRQVELTPEPTMAQVAQALVVGRSGWE
jgi:very-short-patch-repair endonuclease